MVSTTTWTSSDLAGSNAGLAGRVKMWTPPKPRPYAPKAFDPGQRISWTLAIPAHRSNPPQGWNEPMPADAKWVPASETIRYGTIWSAGHTSRLVWVQPDDTEPGDMVLVHTQTLLVDEPDVCRYCQASLNRDGSCSRSCVGVGDG